MPPKILVLRLSSLGDVVLTAPVYRNLKAHWPQARISVMVKPQFRAVLENNPYIDEVLSYRGLPAALREIRGRGFTHLLDLHSTWRTFWLRTLGRVPNTSVYRKAALARRLYVHFGRPSPALAKHTLDRYLESLASWGVPIRHRELSLGDYGPRELPRADGRETKDSRAPSGQRVLLVQNSFLGDTLLSLPLAKRLKEILPGCRLTVLTRPQTEDVFRRSPWVDEVVPDDKRGADGGPRGFWRLARRLRAERFDLALVAHRSLRSALLTWLAGVPRRIGFSASAGSFLFHETVFFPWGMPDLERNLALLLPLKPDLRAGGGDSIYLSERRDRAGTAASLDHRLREAGVGPEERLIGIHPGSAWPTKRWLPERFSALARRLAREDGARVLLIGGPEDAALSAGIARAAGDGVLDWTGKTSLPELIELSRRLSLLVTNDSGPMHIAAASGVPTLAIFGPTTRELGFFPYGPGHRVLEADLSCRPCGLHGMKACPEGHFLCMRLIGVEEVHRNAREMLAACASA